MAPLGVSDLREQIGGTICYKVLFIGFLRRVLETEFRGHVTSFRGHVTRFMGQMTRLGVM